MYPCIETPSIYIMGVGFVGMTYVMAKEDIASQGFVVVMLIDLEWRRAV